VGEIAYTEITEDVGAPLHEDRRDGGVVIPSSAFIGPRDALDAVCPDGG